MVAQTALRPPPGRRSTTEEPTTNSDKSVNSVEETTIKSSENPPTIPTEPSVALDPVANSNDTLADISQPDSSNDDPIPEEIGSGHAGSSDSPNLEHTNEKQDSNDLGQSLLDQEDSVFEKDNKTEIPTITEQSDPSVVVTKPLHGSDKERQCSKTTSQVRHHDLHRQELKLLDERLNNLTLALESTKNFGQLVSIMVKNFVFHTTIFCAILLAELLSRAAGINFHRNRHWSQHISDPILLILRTILLFLVEKAQRSANNQGNNIYPRCSFEFR